jgi:hypothetical protein
MDVERAERAAIRDGRRPGGCQSGSSGVSHPLRHPRRLG